MWKLIQAFATTVAMALEQQRPPFDTSPFGREFRQRRLTRAIVARADISTVEPSSNPAYNADIKEATRIADWAIFSLYLDVLRRAGPGELREAQLKVDTLRAVLTGEL